jgi:hypothetical protein
MATVQVKPALNNASFIGSGPMCNPGFEDCASDGGVMMGTCYYPYANTVVSEPCLKSDSCVVSGYHGLCTKTVYDRKTLENWMRLSQSTIGGKALNSIPLPGSRASFSYDITEPGRAGFTSIPGFSSLLNAVVSNLLKSLAIVSVLGELDVNLITVPLFSSCDIPDFGPDANPQLTSIVAWDKQQLACKSFLSFLPDSVSSALCNLVDRLSKEYLENIAKAYLAVWSRTQTHDIMTQLSNGVRYFDLSIGVNTKEGMVPDANLTLADVKFTNGLFTHMNVQYFFIQVRDWMEMYDPEHQEILIFDFAKMTNLVSNNSFLPVLPDTQRKLQNLLLSFLSNFFGSMLSPSTQPLSSTCDTFMQSHQHVITLFDNAQLTHSASRFVQMWQPLYPFVRSRDDGLNSYDAGPTPDVSAVYGSLAANYPKIGDPNKLTVLRGVGGLDSLQTLFMGLALPSMISNPDGLLQLSMRFTPNFVTNILPSPYGHVSGGWARIAAPSSGYNVILGDNVCAFNFSSLIVAWNREELHLYGGRAVPTDNDDQCHVIMGENDIVSCYTDPAGYSANTCVFDDGRCYSTTANQCQSNDDCSVAVGGCNSTTGGALACNFNGADCDCVNKDRRSCRADRECKFKPGFWDICVANIPGVSDENCKFNGVGCTCDNPDPLAPQCWSDADCSWGPLGSKSNNPDLGSHNCRIIGTESWCATPRSQCTHTDECTLSGAYCRSSTPGGYRCEDGSPSDILSGNACVCEREDPEDVVDYYPENPQNYPGYVWL